MKGRDHLSVNVDPGVPPKNLGHCLANIGWITLDTGYKAYDIKLQE